MKDWGENRAYVCVLISKIPPKFDEKTRKKTWEFDWWENFWNLMKKQRRKPIIHYFIEDEKPPKPSSKNEEENLILIENRDEISGNSGGGKVLRTLGSLL